LGYDLHITRRKDWSGKGNDIPAEEWLAYARKDPELLLTSQDGPYFARWNGPSKYPDPWLDWRDGNVYSKNPDEALIDKMVAIARDLGAQVQGDDGETYHSASEPPVQPKQSFAGKVGSWFRALRPAQPFKPTAPPFKVGDRVLDAFRRETTVIAIDPDSNHGLGKVSVRYADCREASFTLAASGLTPLEHEEVSK
jgi:hypothetical protein